MATKVERIASRRAGEGRPGTENIYRVIERGIEFIINCTFHPHHGTRLTLAREEGTLHIQAESDAVVRQMVALGGGCALAIREEVVEGLSPASLRTIMATERNAKTGDVAVGSDGSESCGEQLNGKPESY